MVEADILIENALIITLDKNNDTFKGSVVIRDGSIIDVIRGRKEALREEYTARHVINGRGMILLPGFINTHVHVYQAFIRAYPDYLPLVKWCKHVLFPFYSVVLHHQSRNDYTLGYYAALLSAIEMIRSGTTCAVCQDTFNPTLPEALSRIGLRAVYAITLADKWLPKDCLPELSPKELVERADKVIRTWHGAGDGMIACMLAPSAVFTCSDELLREVSFYSKLRGIGVSIHVNETKWEVEWAEKNLGLSVVEYLNELGLVSSKLLAVHCVWCNEHELRILKSKGASVSHNPESNMKLASGVAPVPKMLRMGINVALATDGAASNDNLDMIEAMRIAALLHKVATGNAKVITALDVLKMATINGAKALGMADKIGSIEIGKKADVILINYRSPHLQPLHDPIKGVVYCCNNSDVYTVIINGRLVMYKRRILTVNEKEVIKNAIKTYREHFRGL